LAGGAGIGNGGGIGSFAGTKQTDLKCFAARHAS
jgi:hypothetical protein